MRQASRIWLAGSQSLLLLACDGREVPVFELPSPLDVGGVSAAAGSFSAASGGATGVVAPTAGATSSFPSTVIGGASGRGGSGGSEGSLSSAGTAGINGMNIGSTTCQSDADCMDWLCEKPGCDAATGVCVPWPAICPADPAPVCGCDGVTYWNDCIRLRSHARLAAFEQCRATACTCEVGVDCNVPYASCSHLLPPGALCGHGTGACWVLPPTCEPNSDSRMWRECKPPDVGETSACVDTCRAIASEHSYAELHRGDTCN